MFKVGEFFFRMRRVWFVACLPVGTVSLLVMPYMPMQSSSLSVVGMIQYRSWWTFWRIIAMHLVIWSTTLNLHFFCSSYASHSGMLSLKSVLGFNKGSAPFIYLGVPIFLGVPRKHHLQCIANKIRARWESWMGKLLSMAGRVQLVQSVIQAMLPPSFVIY